METTPSSHADAPASSEAIRGETVIGPSSGWKALRLDELWAHREVLYFLALRDVKVRYRQSLFGVAWALAQPILMTCAFAFILGRFTDLPAGAWPYPIFVYAGMLPWVFFSTAITTSGNSVVASERVVTKVYFPRLCIPFASVTACLLDFALASVVLVPLMVIYGVAPGGSILLAPVILFFLVLCALGTGAFLSALMVKFRDVRFILPFLVQIMLFITPSIYLDVQSAGQGLKLLDFHPLGGLISAFRAAVLGGTVDLPRLALSALLSVLVFVAGSLYFRRTEDVFADII